MGVSSPIYIPATQSQLDESSHALSSGVPSSFATGPSHDRLEHLATHVSSGFSATHVPASATPPQGFEDLRVTVVQPLMTLLESLKFTVDPNLEGYKQKMALRSIASLKAEMLEGLRDMEKPDDLKAFLSACQADAKSVESKGVVITGLTEILTVLEDFQRIWAIDEGNVQPRPPFAQIAAVEGSIKESRNRLVQCRDEVSIEEDRFCALQSEDRSICAELASQEAQMSELELAIRANRERLAASRSAQDTSSRRLTSFKEEIVHEEQKLTNLNSEAQALRSSTVEASDVARLAYDSSIRAMRDIQAGFISRIERP